METRTIVDALESLNNIVIVTRSTINRGSFAEKIMTINGIVIENDEIDSVYDPNRHMNVHKSRFEVLASDSYCCEPNKANLVLYGEHRYCPAIRGLQEQAAKLIFLNTIQNVEALDAVLAALPEK